MPPERQKLVLSEQMAKQVEPPGKFSQSLELALGFLANPWKIWETEQVSLRRTVLKLAFADRISAWPHPLFIHSYSKHDDEIKKQNG